MRLKSNIQLKQIQLKLKFIMKKILTAISLSAVLLISSVASSAQTKFSNRNNDERLANRITTTDSTLTYVDSLILQRNEAGIIQVTVLGYAYDTAYLVSGVLQARFNKRRGTLTMSTVTEVQAQTVDAPLITALPGGAKFSLIAVGNNIYVQVKGKHATNITWTCLKKVKTVSTVLN